MSEMTDADADQLIAWIKVHLKELEDPKNQLNAMLNYSELQARKKYGDDFVNKVIKWFSADRVLSLSFILACDPYEIAIGGYMETMKGDAYADPLAILQ